MLSAAALLELWERAPAPAERAAATLAAWTGDDAAADLPLDEVNRRLLDLRAETFGADLAFYTECPTCRQAIEFAVDARSLTAHGTSVTEEPLVHGAVVVEYRVPTTVDLVAATASSDARRALFERCVVRATSDGRDLPAADLPDDVMAAVGARLDERHPLLDVTFDIGCTQCGHRWGELLDVAAHLWSDIDASARRLLHEVALLARAYGWTERDVLRMTAHRRAHYLELAS